MKYKESNRQTITAKKLNILLQERNLTQAEVAKSIGVSPQTFNTWCKGIALPRMGKLEKIADYFNVPLSYMIEPTVDYYKSIDDLDQQLTLTDKLQGVLCQDPALCNYKFTDEQLLDILRYARFLAREV